MKVVVGSKNPVKIRAVENIVKKIWPEAEIISVDTESGVSVQPRSDEECILGATNRAKAALKQEAADFGVGIEGGTSSTKYGMFLTGWTVVISKDGRIGLGSGSRLMLPKAIEDRINQGGELGPEMDKLAGTNNIKHKEGAVGLLTKGLVDREMGHAISVVNAFAIFLSPEFYKN